MFVIGITGPSGAGKGAASEYLISKNVRVIDADLVYHGVISPPSDCLDELVSHFGRQILNSSGALDRPALAKLVFGEENRERLEFLNKITHKYVVSRIRELVSEYAVAGVEACAIDAPLLIEAGLTDDCDVTIAVLADKEIRAARIADRDGIDISLALSRINSQKPDEYYVLGSDAVIYNNGTVDELYMALEKALAYGGAVI
jgi:dephospho-CoA kinase